MAQKITVALEDDLDGGPADETVRFAIGGSEYEIDLSTKNATAFRRQLAPLHWARPQGRPGTAPPPARTAVSRGRGGSIWAGDSGGHRGQRLRAHPASAAERYQATTQGL
jgi:hypothetical protein